MNVNTRMRWNSALWQGQMVKNRLYQARVKAGQQRAIKLDKEIQDRLRNNPNTRDITDGDALNVLLNDLLNPAMADRSLQYIKTPLRHDVIADIPFEVATEGMTVCLDSMTMDGQWPLAVCGTRPSGRNERPCARLFRVALKEDEQGNLEPETVNAVGRHQRSPAQVREARAPGQPRLHPSPQCDQGHGGTDQMLDSSKIEKVLAELEDYQGTTLGDLLGFMQAFNLRFGVANSYRQRMIYTRLYPMLAEQANGNLGTLSTSAGGVEAAATSAVGAAEGLGSTAVADTESLGTKAINDLKSAATDVFKDIGWDSLFGGSSPAPASAPVQAQP